jgi:hypothetical protein
MSMKRKFTASQVLDEIFADSASEDDLFGDSESESSSDDDQVSHHGNPFRSSANTNSIGTACHVQYYLREWQSA